MSGATPNHDRERELDDALRDLSQHIDVPAPRKDYAAYVSARLAAERGDAKRASRKERRRELRPRLAFAAAAVAIAACIAVISDPAARSAVAGWFSFGGISIHHGSISTTGPRPSSTVGADLGLGRPISLSRVRDLARLGISMPSRLGDPVAVYEQRDQGAEIVSFVYRPTRSYLASQYTGIGLLLTEVHSDGRVLMEKILGPGSSAVAVQIGGETGAYLTGPQELLILDPDQNVTETSARLSANSLIWQSDSVTYRLEGAFSKATALAIARSIHPAR